MYPCGCRYVAEHHPVKCPHGKILHPIRHFERRLAFHSGIGDCARISLKVDCLPVPRAGKEVVIPQGARRHGVD